MTNPAAITGLITGLAGLVGAITALVALFKHTNNPNAHQPPGK